MRQPSASLSPWGAGILDGDRTTRLLLQATAAMLAFYGVAQIGWLTDARGLEGVRVWMKPLKFAISLALHFATLAVLGQLLSRAARTGLFVHASVVAAVCAGLFEQAYISIQAARGRASHFNYDTPLESALYGAMGIGALLLVFAAVAMGIALWRERNTAPTSALRTATTVALILGPVLTVAVAAPMSSFLLSHSVGTPSGGGNVPLFGWNRDHGDLRVAHFLSLHMMQGLPVLGWLMDRARITGLVGGRPILLVGPLALLWTGATLFTLFQALEGRPFLPA